MLLLLQKNDLVSAETNTSNEHETEENKTSSTEKFAKNDAVSEEPSTTMEVETKENKSSGTQKGKGWKYLKLELRGTSIERG